MTSCALLTLSLRIGAKKDNVAVAIPVINLPIGKVRIYGIKNCDTMKKARAWLDANGVAYEFHDYKAIGLERARLEGWAAKVGW